MNNINDPKKRWGCLQKSCFGLIVILVFITGTMFWAFRSSHSVPDKFVLTVPLSGSISEIRHDSSALPFFTSRASLSLQELLFILDHATTDDRVKEVLLDIGGLQTSPAKIAEIRQAVEKVRKGGKKVTAFLHSAEDSDYLLATACDTIIIERGGNLLMDGLKAETLYYTTPLGKIGIAFQAAQWKKYKSGIEPYMLTGASKESLEEVNAMLDEVYENYLACISRRRGLSREFLKAVINNEPLMSAKRAQALKLVDGISSSWELQRTLTRKITGQELTRDNDAYVRAAQYRSDMDWPRKADSGESIAVVTLSGMIVRSAGESAVEMGEAIDVETVRNSLDAALENKKVKAIVVRIDSPGGDALASADMLQMLDSAAVRKPLLVSMSGVAASGGYMTALAGKTVFAQPLTITGSIGVYALKPNIKGLSEKIGIGRTVVTRGRFADANSLFKPLEGEEYRKFVAAAGEVYADFIGKVARSRKMKVDKVDSVAGGRVWTGTQAMRVGLVDRMGGLFDAIHAAQVLAKIDLTKHPKLLLYPAQKSWWEFLLQGNDTVVTERISSAIKKQVLHQIIPEKQFSTLDAYYEMLMESGQLHMLAVMPCEINIH